MKEIELLRKMLCYVREVTDIVPDIGIILGSGLGHCNAFSNIICSIDYDDIPGFPRATVHGHKGKLQIAERFGSYIVILQGRIHYYEGYDMEEVVRPVRLLRMLGVKTLIITNAAGALNQSIGVGDVVLIKDHISSFVPNPLRGENIEVLGTRFPDMSKIYSESLINEACEAGREMGLQLKEGVYLQTSGPSFESPAEINMYRLMGADLVGMSTSCEAITAVHMGMEVGAVTFVSNMASGMSEECLSIVDVINNAEINYNTYMQFLTMYIDKIIKRLK